PGTLHGEACQCVLGHDEPSVGFAETSPQLRGVLDRQAPVIREHGAAGGRELRGQLLDLLDLLCLGHRTSRCHPRVPGKEERPRRRRRRWALRTRWPGGCAHVASAGASGRRITLSPLLSAAHRGYGPGRAPSTTLYRPEGPARRRLPFFTSYGVPLPDDLVVNASVQRLGDRDDHLADGRGRPGLGRAERLRVPLRGP